MSEKWHSSLDKYLITPPYDNDIIAGKCACCSENLYQGQFVYYQNMEGLYFCDKDCFKEYVKTNDDELDYYIELLEDDNLTYETVIEKVLND